LDRFMGWDTNLSEGYNSLYSLKNYSTTNLSSNSKTVRSSSRAISLKPLTFRKKRSINETTFAKGLCQQDFQKVAPPRKRAICPVLRFILKAGQFFYCLCVFEHAIIHIFNATLWQHFFAPRLVSAHLSLP
jgi:hypothetical protein